jgi:hypothetical protein
MQRKGAAPAAPEKGKPEAAAAAKPQQGQPAAGAPQRVGA